MIELKSAPGGDTEMVDLFSVDGMVYQVARKPRLNVTLRYLGELRRRGEMFAGMQLLEDLLGEKGYTALMEYEGLTTENLNEVLMAAATLALGSLEAADPKSSSGPKK